jgi:hypothetical protein
VSASRRLDGPEIGEFQRLLRSAFVRARFDSFLLYRLGRHIDDFAGVYDDYPTTLRKVIENANAELWWQRLLSEARKAVPRDAGLQAFGERFGVSPVITDGRRVPLGGLQLQHKIKEANPTYDVTPWRNALGEIEGRVCRVEYPRLTAHATGFMVGPDAVLTNYHAVAPVIDGDVPAGDVVLRFDYRVAADGLTLAPGTEHRLAEDWKIDVSPPSPLDEELDPDGLPEPDELDYALLRVDRRIGEEPVGGQTEDPAAVLRGWVALPTTAHDFAASPSLFIVQHPDGKALQVAVDTEAVLELNDNGTRVRYTTNTEAGSSGSPCFGGDWQWVALHQAGDPKYWYQRPDFNQGIPVAAIRRLTAQRGTDAAFGG